jgi:excisionase family DNA binding protein
MTMPTARNMMKVNIDTPGELGVKWMTTGQIATLLGVSQRMVSRWIDEGRLIGIRLPGSRERRVHPDVLREFQRYYGFDRARGMRE